MNNNEIFMVQMDKANTLAQSRGYVNAIAWARKAYENQKITQYDYKKFENLHELRNLFAHGSACDIQISDDTLMNAFAFSKAVSQIDIAASDHQESFLLKEENLNRKRTYLKEGDFVLARSLPAYYGDERLTYNIYVWDGSALFWLSGKNFCSRHHDWSYCLQEFQYPMYVVPNLPDEIVLRNSVTIKDVMHISDGKGSYKYDEIVLNFFSDLSWHRGSEDIINMKCKGYLAPPECFDPDEPLAFEDVKDVLKDHSRKNSYEWTFGLEKKIQDEYVFRKLSFCNC